MILINGRFLSQRITGIQRFAYEICYALHQIGVEFVILAPIDINKEYDIKELRVEVIGGKGSHYWEQVTLPKYVKSHYNGLLLLSLSGLSPLCYPNNIMTIHDISYKLRPRAYSWFYCLYYTIMTPLAAKRARKILTVSEFSKEELIRYLGLNKDKIVVVYNAVRPQPILPKNTETPYLLAVGSLMPRKNLKQLLEAYQSLPDADFKLYVVGGLHASFADSEISIYANTPDIHFLGYVQTEELMQLYRNAVAYINPSLYEGFGIPLVEAMQQECPVVASDIPVFHEVCADAALYFNPLDINDIQKAMTRIVQEDSLRKQLIEKGKKQMKQFNWELSARVIKRLIEEL